MSFQDESTGEITFYMKGADVVMAGIVQYNDWLEEEVQLLLLFFTRRDADVISAILFPV